jgi:drug/metabolite transporter (DMT)-like permease
MGMNHFRDFLKLHAVILSWGLTAVLGSMTSLPAVETVLLRTVISALALWFLARKFGHQLRVSGKQSLALLGNGLILGSHWLLFFFAVEISNASVATVGLTTTMLWTSLLEPILIRGRRLQMHELALGVVVTGGLCLMCGGEFSFSSGLIISLVAAAFNGIFVVTNGQLAQKYNPTVVSFYTMAGACIESLIALPLFAAHAGNWSFLTWPTPSGWAVLLVLSLLCTVLAYNLYTDLFRRLSVFTINLYSNLESVYGILLGGLLLGEWNQLNGGFYAGAGVICTAVLVQPLLARKLSPAEATAPAPVPHTAISGIFYDSHPSVS